MPIDAMTYAAAATELHAALSYGRIERITMPSPDAVLLHINKHRQTYALMVSASASCPGCYITARTFENPPVPYGFLMHLRKHIGGGVIESVTTLPFERVTVIEIRAKDELKFETVRRLYVELIGRQTNIVVTDDADRITECLRHISLELNAERFLLPGATYRPPLCADGKYSPDEPDFIRALIGAVCTPAAVQAVLRGYAPITVREAMLVAFGGSPPQAFTEADAKRLADAFLTLPALPDPVYAVENGRATDFFCRPYLHTQKQYVQVPTLSQAMDTVYASCDPADPLRQRKQELCALVQKRLARDEKKRTLFTQRILNDEDGEAARICGEILTANLYQVPRGASTVTLPDYYTGGTLTIALDKSKTPQQNAQSYYKRYAKRKREITSTNEQLGKLETEIEYLDSVLVSLENADAPALTDIQKELAMYGILRAGKPQGGKKQQRESQPWHYTTSGVEIYVGKNNLQNERLTKNAQNGYVWLHAKDIPGSHVLIAHTSPDEKTLLFAAELAAYYSKAGTADKVPVDYTRVKFVKKIPDAPPGKVRYSEQTTLFVQPNAHTDLRTNNEK